MMTTVLGVMFFIVVALCIAAWVINKKYLQTVWAVQKAHLGEAARNMEAANAQKLMAQGIEECTEQVKKAKTGLVKVQSSITGLERQVKSGNTEETRLTARIKQAMAEGKSDTDPILVQLATSLKQVRENNKLNASQLENQHVIYNSLLGQIQNAQRRAETLENEAENLGSQLETSKLTAELNEFANSFDAGGLHKSLDGVSKYRDLIRKQIDANTAKSKVNQDLGGNTAAQQVWEDNADAKDILSELRNK